MAPRETENNANAKFWGNKQRALWYVLVFQSGVYQRYSTKKAFAINHDEKYKKYIQLYDFWVS